MPRASSGWSARGWAWTAGRGNVRDKLRRWTSIYHFAVEQSGIARGEFLELTIIAILVLELILFFLGIMK